MPLRMLSTKLSSSERCSLCVSVRLHVCVRVRYCFVFAISFVIHLSSKGSSDCTPLDQKLYHCLFSGNKLNHAEMNFY